MEAMNGVDQWRYRNDPIRFASEVLAITPDVNQSRVLSVDACRVILACHRQFGKSTTAAVKAIHHAVHNPDSLTIIVAPTLRQGGLLLDTIHRFARKLDLEIKPDKYNRPALVLPNNARVVAVPSEEHNIRGFSAVSLLLIDEAARVSDEVWSAVLPMVATVNGAIWLRSTPAANEVSPQTCGSTVTTSGTESAPPPINRRASPLPFWTISARVFRSGNSRKTNWANSVTSRTKSSAPPSSSRHSRRTSSHSRSHEAGVRTYIIRERPATASTSVSSSRDFLGQRTAVAADATGLAAPFIDFLRASALRLCNDAPNRPPREIPARENQYRQHGYLLPTKGGFHVPKVDLIETLDRLFEAGRLEISANLTEAEALEGELLSLRRNGNAYELRSSLVHDDLLMALALASWRVSRYRKELLQPPPDVYKRRA